ncbi:Concanavalin A-like lectin/glucanases superfamily [Pseudocohnilembus persalinus]|uniref:Concanavalin A-like lectin/glucanases superfamily n=1 Tax=Pseudocohnilembus persalinus TaxID=266149 RepID=A0A0V0R3F6_PSEPJ|nr:Concanavalin A-like lectin/glucanases superfamily [Pseudocohnilembus persalinus]|eukprot:KRX08890.1 Concanavalin A-like lectin/glucanases superfamily [Pseudocohnilembus persalinus]
MEFLSENLEIKANKNLLYISSPFEHPKEENQLNLPPLQNINDIETAVNKYIVNSIPDFVSVEKYQIQNQIVQTIINKLKAYITNLADNQAIENNDEDHFLQFIDLLLEIFITTKMNHLQLLSFKTEIKPVFQNLEQLEKCLISEKISYELKTKLLILYINYHDQIQDKKNEQYEQLPINANESLKIESKDIYIPDGHIIELPDISKKFMFKNNQVLIVKSNNYQCLNTVTVYTDGYCEFNSSSSCKINLRGQYSADTVKEYFKDLLPMFHLGNVVLSTQDKVIGNLGQNGLNLKISQSYITQYKNLLEQTYSNQNQDNEKNQVFYINSIINDQNTQFFKNYALFFRKIFSILDLSQQQKHEIEAISYNFIQKNYNDVFLNEPSTSFNICQQLSQNSPENQKILAKITHFVKNQYGYTNIIQNIFLSDLNPNLRNENFEKNMLNFYKNFVTISVKLAKDQENENSVNFVGFFEFLLQLLFYNQGPQLCKKQIKDNLTFFYETKFLQNLKDNNGKNLLEYTSYINEQIEKLIDYLINNFLLAEKQFNYINQPKSLYIKQGCQNLIPIDKNQSKNQDENQNQICGKSFKFIKSQTFNCTVCQQYINCSNNQESQIALQCEDCKNNIVCLNCAIIYNCLKCDKPAQIVNQYDKEYVDFKCDFCVRKQSGKYPQLFCPCNQSVCFLCWDQLANIKNLIQQAELNKQKISCFECKISETELKTKQISENGQETQEISPNLILNYLDKNNEKCYYCNLQSGDAVLSFMQCQKCNKNFCLACSEKKLTYPEKIIQLENRIKNLGKKGIQNQITNDYDKQLFSILQYIFKKEFIVRQQNSKEDIYNSVDDLKLYLNYLVKPYAPLAFQAKMSDINNIFKCKFCPNNYLKYKILNSGHCKYCSQGYYSSQEVFGSCSKCNRQMCSSCMYNQKSKLQLQMQTQQLAELVEDLELLDRGSSTYQKIINWIKNYDQYKDIDFNNEKLKTKKLRKQFLIDKIDIIPKDVLIIHQKMNILKFVELIKQQNKESKDNQQQTLDQSEKITTFLKNLTILYLELIDIYYNTIFFTQTETPSIINIVKNALAQLGQEIYKIQSQAQKPGSEKQKQILKDLQNENKTKKTEESENLDEKNSQNNEKQQIYFKNWIKDKKIEKLLVENFPLTGSAFCEKIVRTNFSVSQTTNDQKDQAIHIPVIALYFQLQFQELNENEQSEKTLIKALEIIQNIFYKNLNLSHNLNNLILEAKFDHYFYSKIIRIYKIVYDKIYEINVENKRDKYSENFIESLRNQNFDLFRLAAKLDHIATKMTDTNILAYQYGKMLATGSPFENEVKKDQFFQQKIEDLNQKKPNTQIQNLVKAMINNYIHQILQISLQLQIISYSPKKRIYNFISLYQQKFCQIPKDENKHQFKQALDGILNILNITKNIDYFQPESSQYLKKDNYINLSEINQIYWKQDIQYYNSIKEQEINQKQQKKPYILLKVKLNSLQDHLEDSDDDEILIVQQKNKNYFLQSEISPMEKSYWAQNEELTQLYYKNQEQIEKMNKQFKYRGFVIQNYDEKQEAEINFETNNYKYVCRFLFNSNSASPEKNSIIKNLGKLAKEIVHYLKKIDKIQLKAQKTDFLLDIEQFIKNDIFSTSLPYQEYCFNFFNLYLKNLEKQISLIQKYKNLSLTHKNIAEFEFKKNIYQQNIRLGIAANLGIGLNFGILKKRKFQEYNFFSHELHLPPPSLTLSPQEYLIQIHTFQKSLQHQIHSAKIIAHQQKHSQNLQNSNNNNNNNKNLHWDTEKCAKQIVIDDADPTKASISQSNYVFRSVLTNQGFSDGVHYWEINIGPKGNDLKIGVSCQTEFNYDSAFCDHKFGFGIYGHDLRNGSNASGKRYSPKIRVKPGCTVGVCLNMELGQLSFSIDGTYLGIAFEDPQLSEGTIYPAVSFLTSGSITANFNAQIPEDFGVSLSQKNSYAHNLNSIEKMKMVQLIDCKERLSQYMNATEIIIQDFQQVIEEKQINNDDLSIQAIKYGNILIKYLNEIQLYLYNEIQNQKNTQLEKRELSSIISEFIKQVLQNNVEKIFNPFSQQFAQFIDKSLIIISEDYLIQQKYQNGVENLQLYLTKLIHLNYSSNFLQSYYLLIIQSIFNGSENKENIEFVEILLVTQFLQAGPNTNILQIFASIPYYYYQNPHNQNLYESSCTDLQKQISWYYITELKQHQALIKNNENNQNGEQLQTELKQEDTQLVQPEQNTVSSIQQNIHKIMKQVEKLEINTEEEENEQIQDIKDIFYQNYNQLPKLNKERILLLHDHQNFKKIDIKLYKKSVKQKIQADLIDPCIKDFNDSDVESEDEGEIIVQQIQTNQDEPVQTKQKKLGENIIFKPELEGKRQHRKTIIRFLDQRHKIRSFYEFKTRSYQTAK